MAYVNEMECCGLRELSSVGHSSTASIRAAIGRAGEEAAGLVLATTTDQQKPAAIRLRKIGFKQVRRFKNPNTGNIVTLWVINTGVTREEIVAKRAEENNLFREVNRW